MTKIYRYSLGLIALAASFQVSGDETTTGKLSERDFFSDMPVVLTASRLAQPLRDIPGSMTVIDHETIRRMGARNLADVLRWVPGFQVAQGSNGLSAPIAVYHGLAIETPQALQVLVDGRSQYSPLWFGGVNFNLPSVALEDIERIEILRGSNSASYGSNAMLGVVNIITTEPALARGKTVSVTYGNQGVRDIYARLGWGTEESAHRLSISERSDEGLAGFRDSSRMLRAEWRGDLKLSPRDDLRLIVGGVENRLGIGFRPYPGNFFAPERDRKLASYHVQSEWTHRLDGDDKLSLRYFRVHETGKDQFLSDTGLQNLIFNPATTIKLAANFEPRANRDDFEFEHTLHFAQATRAVWGIGLRRDEIKSQQFFATSNTQTVVTKRLFGHLEWRPESRWLVNLGGMWEDESISGKTFAPRAFVNYRVADDQTVRLGKYRAFQTPSIMEQRARTIVNDPTMPPLGQPLALLYNASGGLKPERLDAWELSYLGDFRPRGISIDARLSQERIKNKITGLSRSLPDACIACALGLTSPLDYANGLDPRIRAFEYQIRWQTPWAAQIWFNQSFIRMATDRVRAALPADAAAVLTNYVSRSAPRRTESIHWRQELPGNAYLTISYTRTDGYTWSELPSSPVARRLDWRLSHAFKSTWGHGEIALTGRATNGQLIEYGPRSTEVNILGYGNLYYQPRVIDPRYGLSLRMDF